MDPLALVLFLTIGLVAGWLASILTKGRGLGLVGNLVVGVIGALRRPSVAGARPPPLNACWRD
jgi:uncharacterized membrane protein YeaQ/YmgE (transglycosylase-associated protein family)